MDKKVAKLYKLKARKQAIIARGKYLDAPGVLKKVTRQIATLERELAV